MLPAVAILLFSPSIISYAAACGGQLFLRAATYPQPHPIIPPTKQSNHDFDHQK
jgi:hypothetical protein